MLTKRVIPCLDVKDGRVVKGTSFVHLRDVSEAVSVPVVASGGAGTPEDLYRALILGKVDAVLAASIFHHGAYSIRDTKRHLADLGIPVRI